MTNHGIYMVVYSFLIVAASYCIAYKGILENSQCQQFVFVPFLFQQRNAPKRLRKEMFFPVWCGRT